MKPGYIMKLLKVLVNSGNYCFTWRFHKFTEIVDKFRLIFETKFSYFVKLEFKVVTYHSFPEMCLVRLCDSYKTIIFQRFHKLTNDPSEFMKSLS